VANDSSNIQLAAVPSGFEKASANGEAGQLEAVAQAELFEHIRPVPVNGLRTDHQDVGNLFTGVGPRRLA